MNLNIKITKMPKDPRFLLDKARQQAARRFEVAGKEHVSQREQLVSSWKTEHRPEFASSVAVTPGKITLTVFVRNGSKSLGKYGGTIAALWKWWNEGTKAHSIVPRFRTILRFTFWAGVVFARRVRHPGFAGHHQDERINERLSPPLKADIKKLYGQGLKGKG